MSADIFGGSSGSSAGSGANELLHFSEDAVAATAGEVEQRARDGHARWASAPDISAADCGQGFAAQGLRLQ